MKAVICGAGIAGLAAAERLHAIGWDVLVVEKAPGPRPQGYMIDFFGPGYEAAEAMGLEPRLRELAGEFDEVAFIDGDGRKRAHIDYAVFRKAVTGGLMSIMRPDIELVLREALAGHADLRYGLSVDAVDNRPDGVTVTLTDGTAVDADLLIGADGIHSHVRALVFGPEEDYTRHLGYHTAAFVFDDPEIGAAAHRRFTLTDAIDRQMGFYGLGDGRVASYAVHRAGPGRLPADPREALRREYGGLGWLVPRALAACPEPGEVYYDHVAQTVLPRWSRDRVVLLGDAAYAVSLLAGQGASLAIAGAYVLAARLADRPVAEALTGFEHAWRPVAEDKQDVARAGARWFLPANRAMLTARRLLMRALPLPVVGPRLASGLVGKSHDHVASLAQGGTDA